MELKSSKQKARDKIHVKKYSLDLLCIAKSYLPRPNKLSTFNCHANVRFPQKFYKTSRIYTFDSFHHREWDWYRFFGQFFSWPSRLRRSLLIQIARKSKPTPYFSVIKFFSVTMTWAWYAFQSAMINIYNAYRLVALLNAFWNVTELRLSVVNVSNL